MQKKSIISETEEYLLRNNKCGGLMKITKIFSLALRNIFRNKRRTTLTFFAIISGMVALVVFGGFVHFSFWGLRESTIRSQLGHIQIYKKGYSQEGLESRLEYLIDNFNKVEEELRKMPNIEISAPRLSFAGLISGGENTHTCLGIGGVREKESKLATFEALVEGEDIYGEDEAVIGSTLKKSLGVEIGNYVTLLTMTVDGSINAVDVKVVGVSQSGSREYDSVVVKLPLTTVQRLLNTNSVEKILLLLDKTEHTLTVATQLTQIFEAKKLNLELKKWDELASFYRSVVRLYTGIFNVMKVIIAVIVFFSIANTMTMSIFERTREIGTIRAIGTRKSTTILLFFTEGFLIGIIGGMLGIITGIVVATVINTTGGIYVPPPPMMTQGYSALILIVPKVVVYSYISTVLVSIVSSFYPAFRAANLSVVEALRHS